MSYGHRPPLSAIALLFFSTAHMKAANMSTSSLTPLKPIDPPGPPKMAAAAALYPPGISPMKCRSASVLSTTFSSLTSLRIGGRARQSSSSSSRRALRRRLVSRSFSVMGSRRGRFAGVAPGPLCTGGGGGGGLACRWRPVESSTAGGIGSSLESGEGYMGGMRSNVAR